MAQHTIFLVTSVHPGWTDLRAWLRAVRDVGVIGEIGESRNLDTAVRAIAGLRPSLVIIPLHRSPASAFSDGTSLPLLGELRISCPESKLLVIADHLSRDEALALAALRIDGVVAWDELTPTNVATCVAAIADSGFWLRNGLFVEALLEAWQSLQQPPAPVPPLPEQEQGVLEGLAAGETVAAIAHSLRIGRSTVKRTIISLETRLGADNRQDLLVKATRLGLIA